MLYLLKKFEDKDVKDKTYRKVRDHCHCTSEYREITPKNIQIYLKKLQSLFTMDQTMVIILS